MKYDQAWWDERNAEVARSNRMVELQAALEKVERLTRELHGDDDRILVAIIGGTAYMVRAETLRLGR